MPATPEVFNQVPAWPDYDVSACDPAMAAALHAGSQPDQRLRELGILAGTANTIEQARLANRHFPAVLLIQAIRARILR